MNSYETAILIISLACGTAYSVLILSFTVGWLKLKQYSNSESPTTFISILIPYRNEQENIDPLMRSLKAQNYPQDLFELIFINDHSEDSTHAELIKHEAMKNTIILALEKGVSGKKAAIDYGVRQARGKLITTLDADCIPGKNWLWTISTHYEKGGYKMIAGSVAIRDPKGFLASFQALELLSLVSTGAGAIGIKKPIMCNGANLSYEKEAFLNVEGFKENEHIPGGDDIFLMEKFNKHYPPKSIGFNTHPEGIVYTGASRNLKAFMNQRFRWVAKSPAYRNPFLILSALIVLLFNLCLLTTLIFAFTSLPGLLIFGGLFLIKCLIDFPILWKAAKFAKQTHLMGNYVVFQFVYFIFISLSGLLGNLLSFGWKGR